MRTVLQVEVWSDVVCPWCFIGKQRFERAVAQVADDIEVQFVYRPYQLDPRAPTGQPTPVAEVYAKKFGGPERATQIIDHVTSIAAAEGIEFHMDRAVRANTLAAHRLLWLAEATGHQHQLKERLLRAYFQDGSDVGNVDVLADCAADVGMDRDRVRAFLSSDDGTAEVRALIATAVEHDIAAVPTYVIAPPGVEPAWMVPGAQDTDVFVNVLRRSAARAQASNGHQAHG
jgi:predicted DsbA family dithiol-disulfide isomerase